MDYTFPESEQSVRATIARALELKGMSAESQLLRMATLTVQHTHHDGWNGGVDYYAIDLRIPLEVFVQIESQVEEHETRILEVAKNLWRDLEADIISTIRFVPNRADVETGKLAPAAAGARPSFWDSDQLRLFLSHCSSVKVEVAQLKAALATVGVCGFVAHDDIEPSTLWQGEIERALQSCEALAAVVTDDFSTSLWCDQEVGFALGRGLPVLPVQFGRPPHGFIGKIQALPVLRGETLSTKANHIVQLLLQAPQTAASMTTSLVHAAATAKSFATAKSTAALLETVSNMSKEHGVILRQALKSNNQVSGAFGVPDRLRGILARHKV